MLTAGSFDRHPPITPTMSYEDMLIALEPTPVRVIETLLDGDVTGLYDEEYQCVLIDQAMLTVQKKCTLVHELFHWMHADDTCDPNLRAHAEHRVRRETAMFLINPAAYILTEREYDGGIYQMACELDVTVQVLEDYRRLLEQDR